MGTGDNEADNIRSDLSENRTKISGDVDTTAPFVWVIEGMIVEDRMKLVLLENTNALVSSFLFRRLHPRVSFMKVAVENDLHSGR